MQFSIETLPAEILDLCSAYAEFIEDTKRGEHGLTAKYWMQYIEMFHLYHDRLCSVREGDLDMFIHTIPKISYYFFAFNQPNYAKWMVQYHNNLLRLNESHPKVNDLTLEQTINADAESQHIGIGAFINSISARQRWSHSHYICMTIITHLLEDVGLKQKADVTRELNANRICKPSADLCSLMDVISESVNPFSPHVQKEFLFNITTGKSASAETTASLLNISSTGFSAQKDFIDECVADPSRFEKPMKWHKLQTLF